MSGRSKPALVIVTGPPGAGKTSVARRLALDLALPLLIKDELKEMLADALEVEGLEWSHRVGGASFELLAFLANRLIAAGVSIVVEGNFDRLRSGPAYLRLVEQHDAGVVQVVCRADPAVLLARYDRRAASGARHPIHLDSDPSVRARVPTAGGAVDLPGRLLEVDTTDLASLDLGAVVAAVQAALAPASRRGTDGDE